MPHTWCYAYCNLNTSCGKFMAEPLFVHDVDFSRTFRAENTRFCLVSTILVSRELCTGLRALLRAPLDLVIFLALPLPHLSARSCTALRGSVCIRGFSSRADPVDPAPEPGPAILASKRGACLAELALYVLCRQLVLWVVEDVVSPVVLYEIAQVHERRIVRASDGLLHVVRHYNDAVLA